MSKIIKSTGNRELSHVIQTDDGKFYVVDSEDTRDCGYETMVFDWDILANKISNWLELYVEWHNSETEMRLRHYIICKNFENLYKADMREGEKE